MSNSYTMRQAKDMIRHAILHPVQLGGYRTLYLEGDPGIGKTSMAYSVFDEMKQSKENPDGFTDFLAYVAPEREDTDFAGLPFPNEKRDSFKLLPLEDFKFPKNSRPFIIIDELDKAVHRQQNVLGRIMHERRANGIDLPPGTFIMAAGNLITNRAGGVSPLTHIKGRRTRVPVHVDYREWIEDVAIPFDLHPSVISYIRTDPTILHKFDAAAASFPSPRAWTKVGHDLNTKAPPHVERAFMEGDVGVEATNTFWGHLQIFRDLRSPEEIIRNPTKCEIPTGKNSVAIMWAEVTSLAKYANKQNGEAIFTYFNRLPGEFGFVGYRDALQRDKAMVIGTKAGQTWAVKNSTLIQNTKA